MSGPAFGFSFGDFVQAIRLLDSVRQALKESGGAKDEFREILLEMQHLEIILEHCGKWKPGSQEPGVNAVKGVALACQVPLQQLLAKLQKYQSLNQVLPNIRRYSIVPKARAVQWALEMRGEVDKFYLIIARKVNMLNLLMNINSMSIASRIEGETRSLQQEIRSSYVLSLRNADAINRIDEEQRKGTQNFESLAYSTSNIETMFRELLCVVNTFTSTALQLLRQAISTNLQIYTILCQIKTNISRAPTAVIEDCFRFTDAFGRAVDLPYQWFNHWEVFEAWVRFSFKDMPGEEKVRSGQYHVLKRRGANEIVEKYKWESVIFPGEEVYMSMIIVAEVINFDRPSYAASKSDLNYESDQGSLTQRADLTISMNNVQKEVEEAAILTDPTTPFHLSNPLPFCEITPRAKQELSVFKALHISFGSITVRGQRTGCQTPDGQISPRNLKWEAYRALQWGMTDVLTWLEANAFSGVFREAFEDLNLQGHRFLRLGDDVESLRWMLRGKKKETDEIEDEVERLRTAVKEVIRLQCCEEYEGWHL